MDRVGVGPRAIAVIIDSLMFVVLACCLLFIWAVAASDGDFEATGGAAWLIDFVILVIYVGYFTILEGTSGATLGKRLLNLKVVKIDGTPVEMREALIRNVLRIIDGFFWYLVGAIIIWTSPNKQRLGDMVAKTIVVRSTPAQADVVTPTERF